MRAPDREARYASAGAALLRAALVPRTPGAARDGDVRAPEDPGRLGDLIEAFTGRPALLAALELASPDLARAVLRPPPDGGPRTAAGRRRMTMALTAYELRSRYRATPYGLFAGTALVGWGPAAGGTIGTGHRLVLRAAAPRPRRPAAGAGRRSGWRTRSRAGGGSSVHCRPPVPPVTRPGRFGSCSALPRSHSRMAG